MKTSEQMRSWNIMEFYNVRKVVDAWADKVEKLEDELGEIQQIASQRGLDSQATYDSVLEDIEDRCLKALGENNEN